MIIVMGVIMMNGSNGNNTRGGGNEIVNANLLPF